MKKYIVAILLIAISHSFLYSQEAEKKIDKPVRFPFESGVLIDNQTNVIPAKGTFEMLIQHRFGKMNNGISDVWGIYAPGANIRMGFNYSLMDNLMIGYGLTKKNMYSDFQVKYNLLTQTRKNTVPLSITLYGNMAIDGRNSDYFGVDYKFTNRFSYFGQLIIGRKFTDWLSLQATASFTHFNKVPVGIDHDKIGVGLNGRIKFSPQSAIIFQYDVPIQIESIPEPENPYNRSFPNFGFGYEVATSNHAFQIYVTTADGILAQDIYNFNQNDFTKGTSDLMFGFTITRLWSY